MPISRVGPLTNIQCDLLHHYGAADKYLWRKSISSWQLYQGRDNLQSFWKHLSSIFFAGTSKNLVPTKQGAFAIFISWVCKTCTQSLLKWNINYKKARSCNFKVHEFEHPCKIYYSGPGFQSYKLNFLATLISRYQIFCQTISSVRCFRLKKLYSFIKCYMNPPFLVW